MNAKQTANKTLNNNKTLWGITFPADPDKTTTKTTLEVVMCTRLILWFNICFVSPRNGALNLLWFSFGNCESPQWEYHFWYCEVEIHKLMGVWCQNGNFFSQHACSHWATEHASWPDLILILGFVLVPAHHDVSNCCHARARACPLTWLANMRAIWVLFCCPVQFGFARTARLETRRVIRSRINLARDCQTCTYGLPPNFLSRSVTSGDWICD